MRTVIVYFSVVFILTGYLWSGTERENFALGVEYMVPGLAEVYARTGVKWAKAMGQGFSWADIEPSAPVKGRHSYRWDFTDRLILEYQKAGFQNFHIYVKSMSPWASTKPMKLIGHGSSPLKPEHIEDYKAFLTALVQRYNLQHPDHVPGLLYSVEYWEIESEWGTGFWQGTVSEYLDLLRIAYSTVKKANPEAKVILIGFFLAGLFEGHPDLQEIPLTLSRMPAKRRKITVQYLTEMKELLAHPEIFDVVEFHSLSDWSEIPGMIRFLRQTMKEYNYEKPIWVGDVNYTASPLVFWGNPVPPYGEDQKPAIQETLKALAEEKHPRRKEVISWFRAEQAKGLVKKAVLAMAEGARGINLGNLKDEPMFALAPGLAGTVAFQGLIDTEGIPARPGKERPAYRALTLLVEKLGHFFRVQSLDSGPGIYSYEFTGERNNKVYVFWYDDGQRYLPGDKEPEKEVNLMLPGGSYLLTETPTGEKTVFGKIIFLPSSGIKIRLTTTPVFLEPESRKTSSPGEN